MNSPLTGKKMNVVCEISKLPFRKEEFEIVYHYYACSDSGEQYTDDRLDNINIAQVHNQYREKYGVPFPEEIRAIRDKYSISASKMSEVLGFGINSYRNYENGEMPSVSNGRLILSISQPKEFIRQIRASSHILTPKEATRYLQAARSLEVHSSQWDKFYDKLVFNCSKPNEFTGYRKPNFKRIGQVISYFFSRQLDLFKTKLNKLLFYADFLLYKRIGSSMTGIEYRAISYGPVPREYDRLYLKLKDDETIDIIEVAFDNGNYGELIKSRQDFDHELFTQVELDVLDTVVSMFRGKTTQQIVDISHEEQAWIQNKDEKKLISYQRYAFQLHGLN